jgi:N-formylglutamate deformylase
MIFVQPGIFHRFDPIVKPLPLAVDVSRSGREYPADFRSPLPFSTLHDNVSMYVDEIWSYTPQLGGTLLYALFPHMYIDANRNELDLDASLIEGKWPVPLKPDVSLRGLGLLKSKSRYGEPVQEKKLTVAEITDRIDRYHRPYHRELESIIARLKSSHGFVYHLSCHCMSAIGAPTHPDPGKERPDFCVGDVKGKTASSDFVSFVAQTIRDQGFSCTINEPYAGGEINTRYGNPAAGIDSIMIEINKKCFMDVETFKKTDGFERIKSAATNVLMAIVGRAQKQLPSETVQAAV